MNPSRSREGSPGILPEGGRRIAQDKVRRGGRNPGMRPNQIPLPRRGRTKPDPVSQNAPGAPCLDSETWEMTLNLLVQRSDRIALWRSPTQL
jgi:hypothetical protein